MDLHILTKPAAACWHSLTIPSAEARDALLAWEASAKDKVVMRVVRGGKATTTVDFFDEIAAALQFPLYFGANWDAFHDCAGDLEWLHARSVVLLIVDAELLLNKAPGDDLMKCVEVLSSAAKELATATKTRQPMALHVVVQSGNGAALTKRWHDAGAKLAPLG